ncbi:hypothetical protein H257_14319 [Aphanomyces astaci]|uniref:Uncharacterized protein n=1 Tax=Aphanomyces astaci TaxID=112090 RepID=W4FTK0_APHAT|nr:hypothetical protein H257_14319 [Aphanomyces astaci]ETV70154.1 hypothetical protein H257_14319 [Aphanomyces astaci]|eukprot:XP_009840385.1 hypothetical protein H257_14319 [Aphanomyces astaci]
MRLPRFQGYKFDRALPAEMHETWAWDYFSGQMRSKQGGDAQQSLPLRAIPFQRLRTTGLGGETESNLQGEYVADLGQNKVERLSSGQPVDNTDVLGRPSAGVHSTKKH